MFSSASSNSSSFCIAHVPISVFASPRHGRSTRRRNRSCSCNCKQVTSPKNMKNTRTMEFWWFWSFFTHQHSSSIVVICLEMVGIDHVNTTHSLHAGMCCLLGCPHVATTRWTCLCAGNPHSHAKSRVFSNLSKCPPMLICISPRPPGEKSVNSCCVGTLLRPLPQSQKKLSLDKLHCTVGEPYKLPNQHRSEPLICSKCHKPKFALFWLVTSIFDHFQEFQSSNHFKWRYFYLFWMISDDLAAKWGSHLPTLEHHFLSQSGCCLDLSQF